MVCFEDSIICVPKNSITSETLCLGNDLRCNGNIDCASGSDEEDCSYILLSGGIKVLIVILVLAIVISIPVLYIIIQKKRGRPVVPACCLPCWTYLVTSCGRHHKERDRSSTELASSSHGNVSNSSLEKDGFTNVGFHTGESSYSRSSPSKDPFNRFKKNVQETDEKLPSYRDWQVNRLQAAPQHGCNYNTPNGHSANQNASNQVQYERSTYSNSRLPPNAIVTTGPVTYSYGPSEGGTAATGAPYAISTKDGQAKYESKSHAYRQQDCGARADSSAAPWQPYGAERNSGYGISAVPPNELRQALEQVSSRTNPQPYNTTYYQSDSAHDTSADTVV